MIVRIIDGRQGKAEAPVFRSRAFQLMVEEARVTPDVVTGTYHLSTFYVCYLSCLYVCDVVLGRS